MFMFIHPLSRIIIVHLLLHYTMLSTEIILKKDTSSFPPQKFDGNLTDMRVRGISRKCWEKFYYECGLQMCIVYRIIA